MSNIRGANLWFSVLDVAVVISQAGNKLMWGHWEHANTQHGPKTNKQRVRTEEFLICFDVHSSVMYLLHLCIYSLQSVVFMQVWFP